MVTKGMTGIKNSPHARRREDSREREREKWTLEIKRWRPLYLGSSVFGISRLFLLS